MQKKRTDNFSKFAEKKKGSAIKESYRQEKRKVKADARAAGEEMRALKKAKARGEAIEPTKVEDKRIVGKNPERKKTPYQQKDFKKGPKKDTGVKNKFREGVEKVLDNETQDRDSLIPLNKFIAHAGVCGRREAAELVKGGKVTVNGDKIFEPGYKVTQADKVTVKGKAIFLQKNNVYILLNKPKDAITTNDDPEGRNTVMDIFEGQMKERIYPVGRLDRNTTGVLLLTNDGELAQRLMHPKYEVKKVYKATLNKAFKKTDLFNLVNNGVDLEDGHIQPDGVAIPNPNDKTVVGIEIHSGRNRIIHRMFEAMGYVVDKLDRISYADITRSGLDRGHWRHLNDKELKGLKRKLKLS